MCTHECFVTFSLVGELYEGTGREFVDREVRQDMSQIRSVTFDFAAYRDEMILKISSDLMLYGEEYHAERMRRLQSEEDFEPVEGRYKTCEIDHVNRN